MRYELGIKSSNSIKMGKCINTRSNKFPSIMMKLNEKAFILKNGCFFYVLKFDLASRNYINFHVHNNLLAFRIPNFYLTSLLNSLTISKIFILQFPLIKD